MTRAYVGAPEPATLPPAGLPGLDPSWSRLVSVVDGSGVPRTWHVLDNEVSLDGRTPLGTLLCVHGNPTWAYLWRSVLADAAARNWRAIAVDQLDMGFSERTGTVRPLAQRIEDLGRLTEAVGLGGPVVTVGHDWGGSISLGWALAHRDQLAGVVLTNTAVSQPPGEPVPAAIRLAHAAPLLRLGTVTSTAFLDTTLALAHPRLAPDVRAAYRSPYTTAARRAAIGAFVDDIPLGTEHVSAATLHEVAGGLGALADVPTLLLWGPRDPVFSDRYLRDLRTRLPHADVHRFEGAGHLLAEDADVAGTLLDWLATVPSGDHEQARCRSRNGAAHDHRAGSYRALGASLSERRADLSPAVVELAGNGRVVSWAALAATVDSLAAGLLAIGVRAGDRVALLVPPGADLTAVVYACLRIGAVIVVADAGLGVPGLHRALRGAAPQHVIGIARALLVARALHWPGQRIVAGPVDRVSMRALGAQRTLADVAALGRSGWAVPAEPAEPAAEDLAAVLFTSGSTGPAKGVIYTHGQLAAVRDLLAATYGVGPGSGLVAAFAPFALFGPALGAVSAVPDMDVTAPGTLTAAALADAVAAVGAGIVFASPAALVGVLASADDLSATQRASLGRVETLLSAGAPVPLPLLRRISGLLPFASIHTPYGMTEALPVTDVTFAELEKAGTGNGVCVGRPVVGVDLRVDPVDGEVGEVLVRGPHVKLRYDQLWATEHLSSRDPGWHRTGDVGHLDGEGRLWIEGRLAHVVHTATGALTPVGVEQRVEALDAVTRAALVGVGPAGTQQPVLVVEVDPPASRSMLANSSLTRDVRRAAGLVGTDVAAVLVVPALPTDIRHNSKIDRTRLASWTAAVLAGGRRGRLRGP